MAGTAEGGDAEDYYCGYSGELRGSGYRGLAELKTCRTAAMDILLRYSFSRFSVCKGQAIGFLYKMVKKAQDQMPVRRLATGRGSWNHRNFNPETLGVFGVRLKFPARHGKDVSLQIRVNFRA